MKSKILVIEDDEAIHELIELFLSELDVEIYPVFNGRDGILKYQEFMKKGEKIDLVITSYNLPDLKGIEVTRRILNINENAIIIAFTATLDSEISEEFSKAGAKIALSKADGFPALKETVKRILNGIKKEI